MALNKFSSGSTDNMSFLLSPAMTSPWRLIWRTYQLVKVNEPSFNRKSPLVFLFSMLMLFLRGTRRTSHAFCAPEAECHGSSLRASIPGTLSIEGGGVQVHFRGSATGSPGRRRGQGDSLSRRGGHLSESQPRSSHRHLQYHLPRRNRSGLWKSVYPRVC